MSTWRVYQARSNSDFVIGPDELAEVTLLVLGAQGLPLDEPVGGVPLEPGLDEPEQHALAEEQPVSGLEVPKHPLGSDLEALDQPGEAVEHVVERQERVGNDDALCGGVRDVPLVPERDVLEPDERVRPHDPREPAQPLGHDRVPLVRHCGRALLPLAERLDDLGDLRPREVSDLDGEALQRGGDERQSPEQRGVAVPR